MPLKQVECIAIGGDQAIWRLDFHAVFPSTALPAALPRTRVALVDLMLAALQAWVRIIWLAQPINADPLIRFVDALSDVVHVAADTQAPQRRTDHRPDPYNLLAQLSLYQASPPPLLAGFVNRPTISLSSRPQNASNSNTLSYSNIEV
jgi:hypothetical protein